MTNKKSTPDHMVENHKINIDTVVFRVPYCGPDLRFAYWQTVTADGEVSHQRSHKIEIPGRYSCYPLIVTHDEKAQQLQIEGSLYGFQYGQNVFTGTSLHRRVERAIRAVGDYLGLEKEYVEGALKGPIDLRRIDLAINLRLDDSDAVSRTLRDIHRQISESKTMIWKCKTSVYWSPNKGREYQFCFYAKGPELQSRRKSDKVIKKMARQTQDVLRIELRLRRRALVKNGLTAVDAWDSEAGRGVFASYLKNLSSLDVSPALFSRSELKLLRPAQRRFLVLLKSGVPMNMLLSPKSLQRMRKDLRELEGKVDSSASGKKTVSLRGLLLNPATRCKAPKWLREKGRAPQPKKAISMEIKSQKAEAKAV